MRNFIHNIYFICGCLFCRILLVFYGIRDCLFPPKTDAVLFVAHPDDDTLFFHSFIKENKPYVCLMTTGWSLIRMSDFLKCMKHYGVRFRAYPLKSRDERMDLLEKQVKNVLSLNNFKIIATHNKNGEYGHEEHIRVHKAVMNICKNKHNINLLCPVDLKVIDNYPLPDKLVHEKEKIFNEIYVTEKWVLDEEEAGTPIWVKHEHLINMDV